MSNAETAAGAAGDVLGVWSAPGRVNFIGEHTDYSGGLALPFAIQHRTFVTVRAREDHRIRVRSLAAETAEVAVEIARLHERFSAPAPAAPAAAATGEATHTSTAHATPPAEAWANYPLGAAGLLSDASADPAAPREVDLTLASDVPLGAGLSSSAALESAVALALNEVWALGQDRLALALAGKRAENEAVGAPTGVMDQLASIFGAESKGLLLDCRNLGVSQVPLEFAAHGLQLLVIDTGVRHSHATGEYGERRASCERGAAVLGVPLLRDLSPADLVRSDALLDSVTAARVRHVVTENERVRLVAGALEDEDHVTVGKHLTASHVSLRDDFEVSSPELDAAVTAALSAGALGARMTGGGFGGAAIALVPVNRVAAVTLSVEHVVAAAGFATPRIFEVRPSAGARRE